MRLNQHGHRIIDENGVLIAKIVANSSVGLNTEEVGEMRRCEMQYAKLFAKSPELLEALQSLTKSRTKANLANAQNILKQFNFCKEGVA